MAKKILIVDDEMDIVQLLDSRLKANGYETMIAIDGLEGLTKAKEASPDLIVLDVMMPKIDGFHVCNMLKSDETHKSIPIILLTAKKEEIDKAIGDKVGADAYMTKPFDSTELLKKIKNLLGE